MNKKMKIYKRWIKVKLKNQAVKNKEIMNN